MARRSIIVDNSIAVSCAVCGCVEQGGLLRVEDGYMARPETISGISPCLSTFRSRMQAVATYPPVEAR